MRGKIKKYLSYRGFGFIEVASKEDDIFFHISNYSGASLPAIGEELEFTLIETPKGEEATEIRVLENISVLSNTKVDTLALDQPHNQETKKVREIYDLDNLHGIGPKYQELLCAVGINSIDKLAKQDPGELYNKLCLVNEGGKITKRPPNLDNVEAWIKLAKD